MDTNHLQELESWIEENETSLIYFDEDRSISSRCICK